jgi:DNA-binding IclR family transcriptional regulator
MGAPAAPRSLPAVFERQSRSNRSLARGLLILRAFRPGVDTLSNSELADTVGLPRSTVSRLTQTLVESGFLEYVFGLGAYRLAPPVLSLGLAMQQNSGVLKVALPLMRSTAEGRRINVGIATNDETDMIYLASIRKSRRELFRHVTAGSRIPIALTSLGRAYLSTLPADELKPMLARLALRHEARWPERKRAILAAIRLCRSEGYCGASWQSGIFSLAAPLPPTLDQRHYAVNLSMLSADQDVETLARQLQPVLLDLVARIAAGTTRATRGLA